MLGSSFPATGQRWKERIEWNVSGFTYDTEHINDERLHGVTRADAEKFIQEADISLTRWNSQFINYYSPNGATYEE